MSESCFVAESAPVTGDPAIDAALADVVAVSELDAEEQARHLNNAQAVLAEVLRTSREAVHGDRVA